MIKKKKGRKIAAAVIGFIFIVMLSAFFYVNDYYHRDECINKYLQANLAVFWIGLVRKWWNRRQSMVASL